MPEGVGYNHSSLKPGHKTKANKRKKAKANKQGRPYRDKGYARNQTDVGGAGNLLFSSAKPDNTNASGSVMKDASEILKDIAKKKKRKREIEEYERKLKRNDFLGAPVPHNNPKRT